MSYRRRPRANLPRDDPGRLAALRLLAGIGLPDRIIGQHLGIVEEYVFRLRRHNGIPPGLTARRRWALKPPPKPPRGPIDLEDTGEL